MAVTTRILTAGDVDALLTPRACIDAVEDAFRRWGLGEAEPPHVLGVHVSNGGFHIKAAAMRVGGAHRFAAKTNGNFPGNPGRSGLPSIHGVIVLSDAEDGTPLAVMDSMRITELRTAAATAVAARWLARGDSRTLVVVGCGAQAGSQVAAVAEVRAIERVLLLDREPVRAAALAVRLRASRRFDVEVSTDLDAAVAVADIVVTVTTARTPFLDADVVPDGCFVAAVGADNPEKSELTPALMAGARVVADSIEQCAAIGDLHHALEAGAMTRADVHAELAAVVCGRAAGRSREDERFVFDSTGTALQDVAAASVVYDRALVEGLGLEVRLGP